MSAYLTIVSFQSKERVSECLNIRVRHGGRYFGFIKRRKIITKNKNRFNELFIDFLKFSTGIERWSG